MPGVGSMPPVYTLHFRERDRGVTFLFHHQRSIENVLYMHGNEEILFEGQTHDNGGPQRFVQVKLSRSVSSEWSH